MPRANRCTLFALWLGACAATPASAQTFCLAPVEPPAMFSAAALGLDTLRAVTPTSAGRALLAQVNAADGADPRNAGDRAIGSNGSNDGGTGNGGAGNGGESDDERELECRVLDIVADNIAGEGAATELTGNVEMTLCDARLSAENARIEQNEGAEAELRSIAALGSATLALPGASLASANIAYDSGTDEARMAAATLDLDLPEATAHASAEEIVVRGMASGRDDRSISLSSVLFTTCPEDNRAWELRARDVRFDADEATARGVTFEIKGMPVARIPYLSFPLSDARKSGFLTPDISERDRTGLDLRIPYYLNLADNYDLTLEPRIMSERGAQIRTEFRYLLPRSEGELHFEFLPDDEEAQIPRRYVNLTHEMQFGDGWELLTGIEEVSDDAYFEDLGASLAVTSQTHLNRFVDLAYVAPYWTLLTRMQNYQTIDPFIADADTPYERVPQVLFDGRWFGRLLTFDSRSEIVNFDRFVGPTGWRLDSTQELSASFARPGMYLTPALALRQTNYWLDGLEPDAGDDSLSRTLPVGSLDMGLVFERPTSGTQWLQTLEPRILYVHVPFEDQSALPVFDTILPDFNLVQLFRKYQFVGADRVTDTDQWSVGITTRLIDPAGRERLTATIGQTRYLNAQRVSLPGDAPNVANASDYVAELSMAMREAWTIDMGYQWNDATNSTARVETRFEYRPEDDRLFGFGYRYRRGSLEQSDVSLVWPVAERWRVIGRYSYSVLEREPLEQFGGFEYDACCWRFRLVSRRHVSRRTGETDASIAIQLELKGLSKGARSAEELLDRGILGYRNLSRSN